MFDSLGPHGLYSPHNSPGQNTGVGSLSLLQWILPTQRLSCIAGGLPTELPGKPSPISHTTNPPYIPGPSTTSNPQHPISHILCPIFTPSIVKTCTVSTPSQSNPFQKPQLTALPCPALPSLSHMQSSLLLHLFTGTHIHHEPQEMPQESRSNISPLDLPPGPGCDG